MIKDASALPWDMFKTAEGGGGVNMPDVLMALFSR